MTRSAQRIKTYRVEPQVQQRAADITVLDIDISRRRRPFMWVFWVLLLVLLIAVSSAVLWHMIGAVSVFYTNQYQGGPSYSAVQWNYANHVEGISKLNVFDVIANFHPAIVKVSKR